MTPECMRMSPVESTVAVETGVGRVSWGLVSSGASLPSVGFWLVPELLLPEFGVFRHRPMTVMSATVSRAMSTSRIFTRGE